MVDEITKEDPPVLSETEKALSNQVVDLSHQLELHADANKHLVDKVAELTKKLATMTGDRDAFRKKFQDMDKGKVSSGELIDLRKQFKLLQDENEMLRGQNSELMRGQMTRFN
jgi:hypothetical protein